MIVLIKNITILLLLFLFNLNLSAQIVSKLYLEKKERKKYFASFYPSPSRHNILQIKMFSSNHGFASGNYFLVYNGNDWNLSEDTESMRNISCFYAVNEKNIYYAKSINPLSESEFYFYNGRYSKKLDHPFGNTISTIFVTPGGKIWIGGDREIAFYDGNWHNLPSPTNLSSIVQIFASDKNEAWAKTTDNKLFFYSNNKWTQYLSNEEIKCIDFKSIYNGIILAGNRILRFSNFSASLIDSDPRLSKALTLYSSIEGSIWLVGTEGLIIHYNKGVFEVISTDTRTTLYSLSVVSEDEIWVGGNYGTLLKIADKKFISESNKGLNFISILPVTYAKNLDDQFGVAIEDLNNDGFKDIYIVCIYNPNNFYLNNLSDSVNNIRDLHLSFSEESVRRNTTGITSREKNNSYSKLQLGAGVADIDNDGDEDIYICSLMDKNKLLLNDGNGYFRDVSDQSERGTGEKNDRTNAAVFADIDNDGDLDMFITNEYSTNRLFENNGNGYFKEITKEAGLTSNGSSMGASFADVDDDGLPDLCVANWARENNFYKNVTKNGETKFIDIAKTAGTGGDPSSKSNAVVFADYNNDGLIDLLITNRGAYNRLYKNIGNFRFIDVTEKTIGLKRLQSYGAEFGDFDNDGFLELYIANVGKNLMLKNLENGSFSDITFSSGTELSTYSTGTAIGDLDNDGDLDMYCSSFTNGSSALFINIADNKNFITMQLEGTKTNRDAIGAKTWFYKAGHAKQKEFLLGYRQIISGTGYCSHDSKEIHFGTGDNDSVDIVILFSSNSPEIILKNVKEGSRLVITEETGSASSLILIKKTVKRFFSDSEIRTEILKFIIVLFFISLSIIRWRRRYKLHSNYIKALHLTGIIIYFVLIVNFLHREIFLSVILPILFIILFLTIIHLYFERVVVSRRINEERQNTRNKIARDLHDDLASTISSSKIYLDVLHQSIEIDDKSKNILKQISLQMAEAYEKISDLVWTISPSHDSTKDLIARLRVNMREQCELKNIIFKNISHSKEIDIIINDETRRNIYSIFKEAFHNSIVHSKASEIIFSTNYSKSILNIQLQDNGIGIPDINLKDTNSEENNITGTSHGNGLKNMPRRAKEINGQLDIQSGKQTGTSITLIVKIV